MKIGIIGAGIVGLSIARWLSRYENVEVHVFDKNPDVGWGVTKANTSIIHPCHEEDPDKHPLRTKLCLEGHDLWYEWVRELDIPSRWPGEIIVAFSDEEIRILKHYLLLAIRNKVPGVKLLDKEELLSIEPKINPSAIMGLYAPSAGSIDPIQAAIAIAENCADNNVYFHLGEKVSDIITRDHRVVGIVTSRKIYDFDIVINAAGLYADEISRMTGINDYYIFPRRGQYILYDSTAEPKPEKIIHTTPTPKTKGVYVLKTTDDTLLIGPTAEDLPPYKKNELKTTREGINYLLRNAEKLLPRLPPRNLIIKTFAGLRPEPSTGSFIIRFHEDPWGFIDVAGIRSPGLTAAPAIGKYVVELLRKHIDLKPKNKWKRYRKGIVRIKDLGIEDRNKLISKNPSYGRIICQCRGVSEAEIVEAINRMKKIGVKEITLDGIKFRTHSMYGRCQGSFCRVLVSLIISRYIDVKLWQITFRGGNSFYGIGEVKSLFKEVIR